MALDYYVYSDKGERPNNEDCAGFNVGEKTAMFTVCDGLGGYGKGEVASKTAVDAFVEYYKNGGESVDEAFERANGAVEKKQGESASLKEMKTTATLLVIKDDKATYAHIGDSRINYFKNNKFVKRSHDHSVVQMLCDTGEIKEKEMRRHIDRNRLLRCIPWLGKKHEIDEKDIPLSKGDAFMLMSDGFWDWIDEKAMGKALKKGKTAEGAAKILTEQAFKAGSGKDMDNLTLIVVKIV